MVVEVSQARSSPATEEEETVQVPLFEAAEQIGIETIQKIRKVDEMLVELDILLGEIYHEVRPISQSLALDALIASVKVALARGEMRRLVILAEERR